MATVVSKRSSLISGKHKLTDQLRHEVFQSYLFERDGTFGVTIPKDISNLDVSMEPRRLINQNRQTRSRVLFRLS